MHLSNSGLLTLLFSGSGEVASRCWPEKYDSYRNHSGVYVGSIGGTIASCHDGDAVLWKIMVNEAVFHGLLEGHSSDILKV